MYFACIFFFFYHNWSYTFQFFIYAFFYRRPQWPSGQRVSYEPCGRGFDSRNFHNFSGVNPYFWGSYLIEKYLIWLRMSTIIGLIEGSADHIISSYCHLLIRIYSLVNRRGLCNRLNLYEFDYCNYPISYCFILVIFVILHRLTSLHNYYLFPGPISNSIFYIKLSA